VVCGRCRRPSLIGPQPIDADCFRNSKHSRGETGDDGRKLSVVKISLSRGICAAFALGQSVVRGILRAVGIFALRMGPPASIPHRTLLALGRTLAGKRRDVSRNGVAQIIFILFQPKRSTRKITALICYLMTAAVECRVLSARTAMNERPSPCPVPTCKSYATLNMQSFIRDYLI
jgi:hypothetical protein